MIFGYPKCAFLVIDKGEIVESHKLIVMNGVKIKPLKDGDSYKYLGQDENIGHVEPLNKACFTAEYKKMCTKDLVKRTICLNTLHIMFLHYQS